MMIVKPARRDSTNTTRVCKQLFGLDLRQPVGKLSPSCLDPRGARPVDHLVARDQVAVLAAAAAKFSPAAKPHIGRRLSGRNASHDNPCFRLAVSARLRHPLHLVTDRKLGQWERRCWNRRKINWPRSPVSGLPAQKPAFKVSWPPLDHSARRDQLGMASDAPDPKDWNARRRAAAAGQPTRIETGLFDRFRFHWSKECGWPVVTEAFAPPARRSDCR